MSNSAESANLTEWQAARDALTSSDNNLHDLRKWGFSFVTGLLTVDAVLAHVSIWWKVAALMGTYVLITALVVVDRNYHALQDALAQRAGLIERRSGLDLTQVVTYYYTKRKVWLFYSVVYGLFDLAVLLIGLLVLANVTAEIVLGATYAFATLAIVIVGRALNRTPWVDFGVDSFVYTKGEDILVTLTNLGGRDLVVKEDDWGVYREGDTDMKEPVKVKSLKPQDGAIVCNLTMKPTVEHRWRVSTENMDEGLYRIVYTGMVYMKAEGPSGILARYSLRCRDAPRSWDDAPLVRVIS